MSSSCWHYTMHRLQSSSVHCVPYKWDPRFLTAARWSWRMPKKGGTCFLLQWFEILNFEDEGARATSNDYVSCFDEERKGLFFATCSFLFASHWRKWTQVASCTTHHLQSSSVHCVLFKKDPRFLTSADGHGECQQKGGTCFPLQWFEIRLWGRRCSGSINRVWMRREETNENEHRFASEKPVFYAQKATKFVVTE